MTPHRLIAFNKPYGVLSQFTDADGHPGLAHHIDVPGVYPAGRLDRDSEGLLLLTSDGQLQHRISDPKHKQWKTYLVQIEGTATAEQATQLAMGVTLNDGLTQAAHCSLIEPPSLWEREPPVRFRKSIPTSWLSLAIREGRNRQIRRMTAAVGLPTLRLVRSRIGDHGLGDLMPGQWRDIAGAD